MQFPSFKKFAAVVSLAIPLGACLEDQEIQIAKCRMEARTAAPEDPLDTQLIPKHAQFIHLCMEAAGYAPDVGPDYCKPGYPTLWHNPYCYRPLGKVAYALFKIEMLLRDGNSR